MLRHHRSVLCLAIAPVFLLSGCGEPELAAPSGVDWGLTDPSVRPRLVSSYPANGGVGPFRVFSTIDPSAPHFTLQLNKLVERAAFRPEWLSVEGFERPVGLLLHGDPAPEPGSLPAELTSLLAVVVYDPRTSRRLPYEVGKPYAVVVQTTLADITAQHPARTERISFMPEPYFRVLDISPADGDHTVMPYVPVVVQFNSPVNAKILPALRIAPEAAGDWRLTGADSTIAEFQHLQPLAFGTAYAVEVAETAVDARGHALAAPWVSGFTTRPFEVVRTHPPASGADVRALIWIQVSGELDSASVRQAFAIAPAAAGTLQFAPLEFAWRPAGELHSATTYTVALSTALQTPEGTALAAPFEFSFTTRPFEVDRTSPGNGDAGVFPRSAITVVCTAEVDSASMSPAFAITPAAPGTLDRSEGRYINFYPVHLVPSTTYTVTISTALRSRAGVPLAAPHSFSFTTGEEP